MGWPVSLSVRVSRFNLFCDDVSSMTCVDLIVQVEHCPSVPIPHPFLSPICCHGSISFMVSPLRCVFVPMVLFVAPYSPGAFMFRFAPSISFLLCGYVIANHVRLIAGLLIWIIIFSVCGHPTKSIPWIPHHLTKSTTPKNSSPKCIPIHTIWKVCVSIYRERDSQFVFLRFEEISSSDS